MDKDDDVNDDDEAGLVDTEVVEVVRGDDESGTATMEEEVEEVVGVEGEARIDVQGDNEEANAFDVASVAGVNCEEDEDEDEDDDVPYNSSSIAIESPSSPLSSLS